MVLKGWWNFHHIFWVEVIVLMEFQSMLEWALLVSTKFFPLWCKLRKVCLVWQWISLSTVWNIYETQVYQSVCTICKMKWTGQVDPLFQMWLLLKLSLWLGFRFQFPFCVSGISYILNIFIIHFWWYIFLILLSKNFPLARLLEC